MRRLARVGRRGAEETRAPHDDRQVFRSVARRRHHFDERRDVVGDLLAPVVPHPLAVRRHVDVEADDLNRIRKEVQVTCAARDTNNAYR